MTVDSPIKSSSRAGRFKKRLVSEDVLQAEAPLILEKLAPFQNLLASKSISEAEFTAAYILIYLSHRFPGNWLGAKIHSENVPGVSWQNLPFRFEKNVERRLREVATLQEIIANFSLKSTPFTVNRAVTEWSRGNYGLELMFRIPKPEEVLAQQKHGRRCVTTILDRRVSKYILGERDALSFTMHDLIHADHFYHHKECFQGQLGFYGLLDRTLPYFDLSHEKFASEFEYVIADMNAYAIHLLKCLKSAMIYYFDQDYFNGWLQNLSAPASLFVLNTESYNPSSMDQEILAWLDQFRVTAPAPE